MWASLMYKNVLIFLLLLAKKKQTTNKSQFDAYMQKTQEENNVSIKLEASQDINGD